MQATVPALICAVCDLARALHGQAGVGLMALDMLHPPQPPQTYLPLEHRMHVDKFLVQTMHAAALRQRQISQTCMPATAGGQEASPGPGIAQAREERVLVAVIMYNLTSEQCGFLALVVCRCTR